MFLSGWNAKSPETRTWYKKQEARIKMQGQAHLAILPRVLRRIAMEAMNGERTWCDCHRLIL